MDGQGQVRAIDAEPVQPKAMQRRRQGMGDRPTDHAGEFCFSRYHKLTGLRIEMMDIRQGIVAEIAQGRQDLMKRQPPYGKDVSLGTFLKSIGPRPSI